MTTSMLVCGKANVYGSLKNAAHVCSRQYATSQLNTPNARLADRAEDHAAQRELFVNVLNANATKRDAKQYLARFGAQKKAKDEQSKLSAIQESRNASLLQAQDRLDRSGVNLGGLYAPARAIAETPVFTQHHQLTEQSTPATEPQLHIALVCLRAPESIDDITLDGLAMTLSQLVKLDMRIVIVLDSPVLRTQPGVEVRNSIRDLRATFISQGDRLRKAIRMHQDDGARSILGALEVINEDGPAAQKVEIANLKLILDPLKRGVVPVIPSLAYTASGKLVPVSTEEVMAALTRELSGFGSSIDHPTEPVAAVDRIIVLDQLGGIPSKDRGDGAHVFVNLEQEFNDISNELSEYSNNAPVNAQQKPVYEQHQMNLDISRRCLALLPSDSSALIIAPQEAASASASSRGPTLGAGTRRQKNTLIHNLLTNKPTISSSLPVARLAPAAPSNKDTSATAVPTATLVKRGMPLTIIPAVDGGRGWTTPTDGRTSLKLEEDPRVDFPRLLHLIENSFRRKLDVKDYLSRIEGRIAGIIVAGEYEGGAILTWEMPPGTNDPTRLVPYLDKFAVLQSSQGSSGVADIVFQAMVRTCFPNGVCWRSRKDNPVNKWYFERSVGSWQIPSTNWTVFWTGQGVTESQQRWEDYVGVCRNVLPSWADGKKPD